jgi:protein O-GlcNAc transferase
MNDLYNKAIFLHQSKKFLEAEKIYQKILENDPNNSEIFYLLGVLRFQLGDFVKAKFFFSKSIDLNSSNPAAFNNLGMIFKQQGEVAEAIININKAIELKPNFSGYYNNLALCFKDLKEFKTAINNFNLALKYDPNNSDVYNNLGLLFLEAKDYDEAIEKFLKSIALNKNNAQAYNNLGAIYFQKKEYQLAIINIRNAIEIDPNLNDGLLVFAKLKICDWENLTNEINKLKDSIDQFKIFIKPFIFLNISDNAEEQKKISIKFAGKEILSSKFNINLINKKKYKIAYISGDFYDHPIVHLIKDVFENHNKNEFEFYGFDLNALPDEHTNNIKKQINLINISQLPLDKIVKKIRDFKIDIAIDLSGYTSKGIHQLFIKRIAPIQINYLGYAGTFGHKNMDYIIADKFVIPEKKFINYSEKIIFLPNTFLPHNKLLKIDPQKYSRAEFGLPNNKFIFCCFNNSQKINPLMLDSWCKILKNTQNSILWIKENNSYFKDNFKKEIVKREIDLARIFFSEKTSYEKHIAKYYFADLFLDTFPFGGHTTANECLQSGLPLLTLIGDSFASRVGGSLLSSLKLDDLITKTPEEYTKKAIMISNNGNYHQNIVNKLKSNKIVLSNAKFYAKNLEKAYQKSIENYVNNLPYENIFIH